MPKTNTVIIYAQLNRRWEDELFLNYLAQLPVSFHNRIKKFHYWEDRQRSLIGKLLLLQVLQYFQLPKTRLNEWDTNSYGKPSCGRDFHFNITHSGEWILCVGSPYHQNGIDIERIHSFNYTDLKNTMTDSQWKQIENASCPDAEFFRFWTAKESMVKADGRGLNVALSGIDTNFLAGTIEDRKWHLTELTTFKGYSAFLATGNQTGVDQLSLMEFVFE